MLRKEAFPNVVPIILALLCGDAGHRRSTAYCDDDDGPHEAPFTFALFGGTGYRLTTVRYDDGPPTGSEAAHGRKKLARGSVKPSWS